MQNGLVPKNRIRVQVSGGWVTLSGGVNWNYQRAAAEHSVRKLRDVNGISNEIKLTAVVRGSDVRRRIENTLKRHALAQTGVTRAGAKRDGTARLHGRADNRNNMQAAPCAPWSMPGVRPLAVVPK